MEKDLLTEFRDEAVWFWNEEVIGKEEENQLVHDLIEATDDVLDCIKTSTAENIVSNLTTLKDSSGNILPRFIVFKNLMILLDVSAEILDRAVMYIQEKGYQGLTLENSYISFTVISHGFDRHLSNNNIHRLINSDLDLYTDLLKLVLYASISKEFGDFLTFSSFKLGALVGKEELITDFVAKRSIENSSQIKQLKAVSYGSKLEQYVKDIVVEELKNYNVVVAPASRYLGGQQFDLVLVKAPTGKDSMPTSLSLFEKKESELEDSEKKELENKEVEVMKNWKWAVIEVAFQETTNSTMERKGKQAENGLFSTIDENNHKLVYFVDGAGFFRRPRVLHTLSDNSHQLANLSKDGIARALDYLKEYFQD